MSDDHDGSGFARRRLPADLDAWRAIAQSGGCCDGLAQETLEDLLVPSCDRDPPRDGAPRRGPAREPTVLDSDAILAGARKVAIRHGGEVYTLQVTRQGTLMLTK